MTGSPRSQSYCTIEEVALLYSLQGLRIRAHPSKPRTQRRRETMLLAILSSALIIYAVYITVRMLLPSSPPRTEAPAGTMAEHRKRGEDWEKKAEGSLSHWALYNFFTLGPFSSKYEVAAGLFYKAAIAFKLAKSWDQAGSAYMKLANCRLKMDMKYEAGLAYVDAANCYKKTNCKESISCLEQAVNMFLGVGQLLISAVNYKEIAKLYEAEQNFDQAIVYYERAADLFHSEEATISLKECRGETAGLFNKAAIAFKLAKSWDQAGSAYVKLANFYVKMDMKYEAGSAYVDAANCYKKINCKESISCLEQAVNRFLGVGWLHESAVKYQEIAKLYEAEQNFDQAIVYYERAADLFHSEENTRSLKECRGKIAEFAAQLEDYQKSIEIYEDMARQLSDNQKYEAKELLLHAGICQLCMGKGDVFAINKALDRYQDLDPTFSGTREYKLLADLADAVDQKDLAKFTDAVKEFDRTRFMTQPVNCISRYI
ncbi:alpha-soluble NSF attachment protein-like isoform X2 [Rhododendron vialii]|uniref:alpha-soluble NSF attachment protein-like isoform X2 n=1 Tax=Rhododendron vialii TaxID=182163 RepID=UPI00265F187F|nr:alpha-soluble NSF attachment protein-like isoform X2 [Rhododendron vialii]